MTPIKQKSPIAYDNLTDKFSHIFLNYNHLQVNPSLDQFGICFPQSPALRFSEPPNEGRSVNSRNLMFLFFDLQHTCPRTIHKNDTHRNKKYKKPCQSPFVATNFILVRAGHLKKFSPEFQIMNALHKKSRRLILFFKKSTSIWCTSYIAHQRRLQQDLYPYIHEMNIQDTRTCG